MSLRSRTSFSRHLVVLAAGAVLLLMRAPQAEAQGAQPPAKAEKNAKSEPAKPAPASLLVYVDTESLDLSLEPGTGKVSLELSGDILKALNTSDEGLTPVPAENGGVRIDFQGRYQGVWVAITDAAGKVKPFCITGLSGPVYEAAQAVLKANEVTQ